MQYAVGLRALHVFVIMHLESRKVVHFAVTEHPTLEWSNQRVRNAGLDHELPKFLIHYNEGRYGQFGKPRQVTCESRAGESHSCRSALAGWLWETMGVKSVPIPPGAPNAQAHMERLIGTTRRECLDHLIIWNERHLHRVLSEFYGWYREARVHRCAR